MDRPTADRQQAGDAPPIEHRRLRQLIAPELPAGLLAHSDRVVALAGELAGHHDLDPRAQARTLLAAQGHDLVRAVAPAELLARAQRAGIEIDAVERSEPLLLHGAVGARELSERLGLRDERVLHAVRWHTSGHPDFDAAAWAFFVADKMEPEKLRRWPELQRVLELADRSLEQAALAYLELSLERAPREGWAPHPMALRTRDFLRARAAAQR